MVQTQQAEVDRPLVYIVRARPGQPKKLHSETTAKTKPRKTRVSVCILFVFFIVAVLSGEIPT